MELFHKKRYMEPMLIIEVALIAIGKDVWAALLVNGNVIVPSTRRPGPDVAAELLRQGFDPRAQLVIRAGSRLVVNDMLGVVAGGHVMSGDLGVMDRELDA